MTDGDIVRFTGSRCQRDADQFRLPGLFGCGLRVEREASGGIHAANQHVQRVLAIHDHRTGCEIGWLLDNFGAVSWQDWAYASGAPFQAGEAPVQTGSVVLAPLPFPLRPHRPRHVRLFPPDWRDGEWYAVRVAGRRCGWERRCHDRHDAQGAASSRSSSSSRVCVLEGGVPGR